MKLKFPTKLKIDDGQGKFNLCYGSKGLKKKILRNPNFADVLRSPRCFAGVLLFLFTPALLFPI